LKIYYAPVSLKAAYNSLYMELHKRNYGYILMTCTAYNNKIVIFVHSFA